MRYNILASPQPQDITVQYSFARWANQLTSRSRFFCWLSHELTEELNNLVCWYTDLKSEGIRVMVSKCSIYWSITRNTSFSGWYIVVCPMMMMLMLQYCMAFVMLLLGGWMKQQCPVWLVSYRCNFIVFPFLSFVLCCSQSNPTIRFYLIRLIFFPFVIWHK